MKFRMAKNSLFAILLRSPWWASFAIAAGVFAVARLFVPAIYAAFVPLPFIAIGAYAGWRQLRLPSEKRVADTLEAVRAMGANDFLKTIEEAFRRDGYAVKRYAGDAADFEMVKAGRTLLVACRRWKVARTGVEPLRELDAARRAHDAHECVYVAAGEITDNARAFAAEKRIRLLDPMDLAALLPRARRKT